MIALLLTACLATATAEEPPAWLLADMAFAESSSYYQGGTLHWVNRRRGDHGHRRGPFQMGRAAFADVSRPRERFGDLEHSPAFAEACCRRYLAKWRAAGETWLQAAMHWNAGPGNLSPYYLGRLMAARGKGQR